MKSRCSLVTADFQYSEPKYLVSAKFSAGRCSTISQPGLLQRVTGTTSK